MKNIKKQKEKKEKNTMLSPEHYTKYEKARILGARALQISDNAPILLRIEKESLESFNYNPIKIAELEFDSGILPITVKRPLPKKIEEELQEPEEIIKTEEALPKEIETEEKEKEEIKKEGKTEGKEETKKEGKEEGKETEDKKVAEASGISEEKEKVISLEGEEESEENIAKQIEGAGEIEIDEEAEE